MDNWYYRMLGAEFGPVTLNELIELAKSETLSRDDEVRFGTNGAWRRAGSMGQLMAHMASGAHLEAVARTAGSSLVQEQSDARSTRTTNSAISFQIRVPEKAGWYYKVFGDEFGPISIDELIEVARSHTLSSNDEVRFGATGAWRKARSIGQLMAHLPFESASRVVPDERTDQSAVEPFQSTAIDDSEREDTPEPETSQETSDSSPESDPQLAEVWWCRIQDKLYGPVNLPKLISWAANGRLHRDDQIRFGHDEFVAAGELPGLFPEQTTVGASQPTPEVAQSLVQAAAAIATKSAAPKASEAPSIPQPVANQPAAALAPPPSSPSRPELATPPASPPRPVPTAAIANRPIAPIKRSSSKQFSFDPGKLLVPALGIVAVALLGVGVYFALPFLLQNKAADIARLKVLETAFTEVRAVRISGNAKKEDFKGATDKLVAVAKPIEAELQGKTPVVQVKLRSLAKKLQVFAKEDLVEPTDTEKSVEKLIATLKKMPEMN